ncbi:MAG: hypothetical protein ACK5MT_14520 [Actinomycetales bacterium]
MLDLSGESVNSITTMAADDDGGFWVWITSLENARLVHVGRDNTKTEVILPGEDARVPTEQPALAVCGDDAWFAAGRSVYHVSGKTVVGQVLIPEATPIPGVAQMRPVEIRNVSGLNGVACNGDQAAVTLANSQEAFVLDGRQHVVSGTVPIPAGSEAASIAMDGAGAVAIGLQDAVGGTGPHSVLLVSADQGSSSTLQVQDSSRVVMTSAGFRAGDSVITPAGEVGDADRASANPAGVVVIAGDRAVRPGPSGLVVTDSSGAERTLSVGTISSCASSRSGWIRSGADQQVDQPSGECDIQPGLVTGSANSSDVYATVGGSVIVRVAIP